MNYVLYIALVQISPYLCRIYCRVVDEENKPFSLGIQWVFIRLLGKIDVCNVLYVIYGRYLLETVVVVIVLY